MPKVMTMMGMAVSVILLLVFGVDLAFEQPFGRASWVMDTGFVVCSLLLFYISWTTKREL
ncbi:MAG: hypothetical protein IIA67_06670 [Planctomycetes bacterium]|nr:hypothetical protein [Planctomycetota bacterium]